MRIGRNATTWVLAMATASILTTGCRQKPPVTPPEAQPEPPVVAQVEPAPQPPAPAPYDPFAADLDSLNEYLQREGLLGTVFFEYDSAELSAEARERLTANARFLRERPELIVTIEGHADDRGTNEYNLALGDRRAGAANRMLTTLGVAPERLRSISYGEERPLCGDGAESCWSKNRRAQFVVVGRSNVG